MERGTGKEGKRQRDRGRRSGKGNEGKEKREMERGNGKEEKGKDRKGKRERGRGRRKERKENREMEKGSGKQRKGDCLSILIKWSMIADDLYTSLNRCDTPTACVEPGRGRLLLY